jgi:RNA polymerase sigma factor (sigma-70 family)
MTVGTATAATDDQLVAAARAGSDRALEALVRRYRDRITSYVRTIVGDYGRAEDIVQETFISALKSLRATDREIAFKPWIYQIARNACIDHLRRVNRADEISFDSEDFGAQYERRLSDNSDSMDSAVSQREHMKALKQAFSGLPPSQHEALVMREFQGMSYDEISDRLNVSRSAVESILFRARRGLKDEYDEIATGERCRRVQSTMAQIIEGLDSKRDRRLVERHVYDCDRCRQEAVVMGLGELVAGARPGRIRSGLDKAAALLPLPFLSRRGAEVAGTSSAEAGGRAQRLLSSISQFAGPGAEQTSAAAKAVALVAAATLVGAGGGFVAHKSGLNFPNLPLIGGHQESSAEPSSVLNPSEASADGRNGTPGEQPGGRRFLSDGRPSGAAGPGGELPFGGSGDPTGTPGGGGDSAPASGLPSVPSSDPGSSPLPSGTDGVLDLTGQGGSSNGTDLPSAVGKAPKLPKLKGGDAPSTSVPLPTTEDPVTPRVPSGPLRAPGLQTAPGIQNGAPANGLRRHLSDAGSTAGSLTTPGTLIRP